MRKPKTMVTKADRERAIVAGREREARELLAASIRYSPRTEMIEIAFRRGFTLSIPRSQVPELAGLPKAALGKMTLSPAGSTILLDAADISLGVEDLVFSLLPREALLGAAGAVGGAARSAVKAAAARANGAKGGRPRKSPEPAAA
jgi:hypothetical protein